ncbi:hypothetical protein [Moraxella marmotae]|uniref:hypothetical protein n=1 Tax=Moraxella marmotae TaxID=3344520 RepID=UPI0035F4AA02
MKNHNPSPTKPSASQAKNFKPSIMMVMLVVLLMFGLLVISVTYLLSQYEPKPSADSQAVADNLSVQPLSDEEQQALKTLSEDELDETADGKDDENSDGTDSDSSDEPATPAVQNRTDESEKSDTKDEPKNDDKDKDKSKSKDKNLTPADKPSSTGTQTSSDLYLPSRQTPNTPAANQEYINHEAAAQADAIDEQLSIAINQVRQLNDQKLAAVLERNNNKPSNANSNAGNNTGNAYGNEQSQTGE